MRHAQARRPQPVVDKRFAVIMKVMSDPEVIERYGFSGALVMPTKSPEEFGAFMTAQTEFWAKLVKQLGAVEQ